MAIKIVPAHGKKSVTVAAAAKIGVWSLDSAAVYQHKTYANQPAEDVLVTRTTAGSQYTSGAYSSGATIIIEAGGYPAYYETGTAPIVRYPSAGGQSGSGTVSAMNTSATATVAQLLGGIVTSTTGAAVTFTLPTGTVLDAGSSFDVGDWFNFTIVNTGGNTLTVAVDTGITSGIDSADLAVATHTSKTYCLIKTASNAFTLYRR